MTMSDRIAVMNHGQVRAARRSRGAVRAPEDPLRRRLPRRQQPAARPRPTAATTATPASKLADGTAVRVPAALVEGRDGRVAIGVRPEKIRLFEPEKEIAGRAQPPARRDRRRLVPRRQHPVHRRRSADGHRVTVFEQNVERATKAELWTTGEKVVLAWSPEHCFVVEEPAARCRRRFRRRTRTGSTQPRDREGGRPMTDRIDDAIRASRAGVSWPAARWPASPHSWLRAARRAVAAPRCPQRRDADRRQPERPDRRPPVCATTPPITGPLNFANWDAYYRPDRSGRRRVRPALADARRLQG